MSQYGKSGEESMEEILASIRSSVDTQSAGAQGDRPAAQNATPGVTNGVVHPIAPPMTARAGGGRLQDALSQINVAAPQKSPQPGAAPPAGPSPTTAAPPTAPPASASVQQAVKPNANPSAGLNDLSDLFADPTPVPASKASSAPSSPSTSSATSFGTVVKQNPTAGQVDASPTSVSASPSQPSPETVTTGAPNAPLSSAEAAALVKPQAKPDEAAPAPEVIASMPALSSTPTQQENEPKPKREPSFAALKTLATGSPPEEDPARPTSSAEKSTNSSVLLPEMRDLPGTNPVAEMHSKVASPAKMKTDGFIPSPSPAPSTPEASEAMEDIGDAPTEIVAAQPSKSAPSAPDASADDATAELAPGARVAAASGSRSLEDIVVDLLKPQLAQWLEANMPRIVERALRAEQNGASDKKKS